MMDLGAMVCTVRNPGCLICPLSSHCAARQKDIAERLPVKPAKPGKPQRTGTAYWIEQDEHVWLVKRPAKGLLAGMRALPDDGWSAGRNGDSTPPFAADWRILNEAVQHVFTHFSLKLTIAVTASTLQPDTLGDGEWWPVNSLDSAGLPTLFTKAAKLAMRAGTEFPEDL